MIENPENCNDSSKSSKCAVLASVFTILGHATSEDPQQAQVRNSKLTKRQPPKCIGRTRIIARSVQRELSMSRASAERTAKHPFQRILASREPDGPRGPGTIFLASKGELLQARCGDGNISGRWRANEKVMLQDVT